MKEKSQKARRPIREIVASVTVLTILVVVFLIAPKFGTQIEFKQDINDEIAGLVVVLSFVSVAVRSAVKNFVGAVRDVGQERLEKLQKKEEIDRNLIENFQNKIEETIKENQSRSDEEMKSVFKHEFEPLLLKGKQLYQEQNEIMAEINEYEANTELISNLATILAGVLVSMVGVRTLGAFCEIEALSGLQLQIFHAVDILLTAGLVLGGREAINGLTSIIQATTPNTTPQSASTGK
ncbi:MAG: hypothetical protein EBE86_032100 [Hormoscilla sp. GUM202]|nr:hypothetical protein [Hormoscilla sp. GUM202]